MAVWPFVAFFVSGASSLVFQLIWSRLLHHVFGSSSVAISSVVSVFMGGLGLGAYLFGRYADRIRRPLVLYAFAELGVAAFALCVPTLVDPEGALASVNALLRQRFGSESLAFMLARFVCIVPVLIVPTTLMGSTLPLLARHFVPPEAHAGRASAGVGALYAINTLGAVCGVFLAGFVLMPKLGVAATNLFAVGLNVAIGVAILALRNRFAAAREPSRSGDLADAPEASAGTSMTIPARARRLAALSFALSGFCSLLYEVVWSRALVNTIGGSVYSFALILMTFLVGIGLGSALATACLGERGAARTSVAVTSLLLCLAAPLSLGVRHGAWVWAAAALGSGVTVALVAGAVRAEQRRRQLIAEEPTAQPGERYGLWLFAPIAVSLGLAFYYGGRLEWLVVCAIGSVAALCFALLGLRRWALPLLATVQAFVGCATLVSDAFADEISLTFASMVAPLYHSLGEHVDRVLLLMFTTAALCVLPSALGMGAMFPLTMRVVSGGGARIGREVSRVYAGNTLGSIAGAWLPGFLLMPTLGMQATLHLGIALNWALALILFGFAMHGARARWLRLGLLPIGALAIALLAGATVVGSPLTWNLTKMTLGVFRISLAKDVLDEETWGEPDLVYYRDGLSTTVSVERWGRHYSLKNNGKVEASNGDDMPTQIMVSALPLLFHERGPRDLDVAVIGLGSGVTAGAVTQFPVRSIEVIELERSVAEASRFFSAVNHLDYPLPRYPFLQARRLRLINDDGRNYLASIDKRYDVIVGEPSNPWLTGVSDLFTADHYRLAKRRLAPSGIYCEWIQLYEMSPENVKILYRTFAAEFAHVLVFSAEDLSSDTVLLGSDAPLPLDLERLKRALAEPGVAAELARAYVHSPFDVLARTLLASRAEVMQYTLLETRRGADGLSRSVPESSNGSPCVAPSCVRSPAPINTDDNALIEFAAPRDLIGFERYKGYLQTIYSDQWPYGKLGGTLSGFGHGEVAAKNYAALAISLLAHGRKREAGRALERASEAGSHAALTRARALFDGLSAGAREPTAAFGCGATSAAARSTPRIADACRQIEDLLARGEVKSAKRVLQELPSSLVRLAGPALQLLRGYVLYRSGDHDLAVGDFEAIARAHPELLHERPELHFFLARSHDALQHFDKAVRNLNAYFDAIESRPRAAQERLPEPSMSEAPVTDSAGESDKRFRR